MHQDWNLLWNHLPAWSLSNQTLYLLWVRTFVETWQASCVWILSSQAALVAGMVRIRSKKFNTCGYSFLNLLLTCNHVVSDDIRKASSTAVLSIGHSAFIWSSLSSRYDPNWSSNVFIQSSPNVCSSSSLVGHILKSAIAVAFTTLVSSKRCSKAVHNASTRTFLSVAKMPLPHVNL